MGRVLFTCDVECHDDTMPGQWLLGKVKEKYWLEAAARELYARNIQGVFFVDFVECRRWGDTFPKAIEILTKYNQRIELHAHPGYYPGSPSGFLSDMGYAAQKEIIESAIENYRKYTGKAPEIFRAGSYAVSRETLRVLSGCGMADSSYYKGKSQVRLTAGDYTAYKVKSYPVTAAYFHLFKKYVKHDVNIMLKDVLQKQIIDNDVMLFFHSFSFNRIKRRKALEMENVRAVKRFMGVMELVDKGLARPVPVDEFNDYRYITKIHWLDMVRNAVYIFFRNKIENRH